MDRLALLLVHGTGASTHSWRDLGALLPAKHDLAFDGIAVVVDDDH